MVPVPSEEPPVFSISNAAAQHRSQKLVEITLLGLPTIVIASFYEDPTGMVHTYLHWTELDKCNFVKLSYLEFSFK